jgi:hypothetical protein
MSYVNDISSSIEEFLDLTVERLKSISLKDWESKPSSDKWSKKEILGHLIDSGQTNIRRLIVSQYSQNEKIGYAQDDWVKYNDYHHMAVDELISQWYLTNKQYHRISKTIPVASMDYTCDTSKNGVELVTLRFLINDYWGHQSHHLHQILG